ncbi:porin family protein [Ferrimonas sediminicola]|uniref:Porin family protein n=1 Tax=Ferrimonas sediminicola TaxID=2569538 RepID=A0A4U1BL24_9GAMM|nr:outer membrane beta-barrel protein [Ferrimonas sediminicola]TKB51504.1 porin family protein [Ferrimonas sediminicola]
MKKMVLAALVASLPMAASANWIVGAEYAQMSDDDIDLGALVINAGFQHDYQNGFVVTPSLHLGFGVKDDSFGPVDVDLNSLYGVEVRGQFNFEQGAYLYLAPRYTNFDVEAELAGNKASEDDWQFGAAVGLGYQFTDAMAAEFGFTSYEDLDQWSLGLRFNF